MESKTGRPIGTGYTVVTVARRLDNVGYHILIGRKLYQDIGSPPRVTVRCIATGHYEISVVTDPVGGWGVLAQAGNGMPHIAIGRARIENDLGLTAGTYNAVTVGTSICFMA